jgi:STE24 endopeptidase
MGLWWAQYPADRALREQNLLIRIDQDLPIYTTPPLRKFAAQNFRLQILFTSVPILLILLAHDVIMLVLWQVFRVNVEGSAVEGLVTFASAISVFVVSPVVLWRILGAHPMPASPLRDRLEAMSKAHRLKFRDVLLWPTHNRIANALVMGVAPRFRYVLMSDLLLSEMTDEQIEAVFAHELGHVVHRHMIWYLVFMKVLILALAVVALTLEAAQRHWFVLPAWMPLDLIMSLIGFGGFLLCFGFVSRRFERQADVFAARTLERELAPDHSKTVGPLGASIFASALERVALINNMPIGSRRRFEGRLGQRIGWVLEFVGDLTNNWLHGSIATRMHALQRMSTDPVHTHRFDRRMARLYVGLLVALFVSAAVAWAIKMPI